MARLFDTGIFSVNATNGSVGVGYKLYFYTTGTSTPKATYPTRADADAGTNANANPVVAASDGRFAPIWLTSGDYKVILKDFDDVTLETKDPADSSFDNPGNILFSHASTYPTGTVGKTLQQRGVLVTDAPYLAVNDDTTDYAAEIQAALSSSGTRKVEIPDGTFFCSTALTVPPGVELTGPGTLRWSSGVNGVILQEGARLTNIGLDGTVVDDVAGGSAVLLGDRCHVEEVYCHDWGFHGFASPSGGANRCHLIGNRVERVGHRGTNLSEGSCFNRVIGYEAIDCLRAGFLLGYLSCDNILDDFYIDGFSASVGGAGLWNHMNSDRNIFTNGTVGAQDNTGITCPHILVGAASQYLTFSDITLTGVGTRGVYVWNLNVDNPSLGTSNAPLVGTTFSRLKIFGTDAANSNAISFKSDNGQVINRHVFDDIEITGFVDGFEDLDSLTNGLEFRNLRFGTISGRKMRVGTTADNFRTSRRRNCEGLTAVGSLAIAITEYGAQPAVPATTVTQTQYYPFPVNIYVEGLPAGSNVLIDGTNINSTAPNDGNGVHTVYPGQTIALSYASGSPTWRWFGLDW